MAQKRTRSRSPGRLSSLDLGVLAVGEADVDEADGFAASGPGAPPAGAGEAGDADAEGGSVRADAFGEGAGDLFGLTAPLVSMSTLGTSAKRVLSRVGVDDGAAEEGAGAVGDGGEALGEQAAGAAFGGGEGEVAQAEHEEDDLFEGLAVGGEDVVAHLVLDELGELVDAGLGLGEGGLGAGEVELDFAGAGEDGGLDVGVLLVDGGGAGVDLGLGDEGHAEDGGWRCGAGAGTRRGGAGMASVKMGLSSLGGPGRRMTILRRLCRQIGGVEVLAGGAAVGVGEEGGAVEDVGLLGVVGRHGDAGGRRSACTAG